MRKPNLYSMTCRRQALRGFRNEGGQERQKAELIAGNEFNMQRKQGNAGKPSHRYSAKDTLVPVSFICSAPKAKSVSVIGDFNEWNPEANRMKRHPDGSWQSSFPVHSGHHRYQFLIDGVPHLDPQATGVVKIDGDSKASLLSVS